MAHTRTDADSHCILVQATSNEGGLDAAQWTAMRVLGNIMAQNRYSDILHTCPEGHALKVTAMAYSLLPNSLDSKKISADYLYQDTIYVLFFSFFPL